MSDVTCPTHDGILSTIGRTPLVLLRRVLEGRDIDLYAKLEGFNPGGSLKDRPAVAVVRNALAAGVLQAGGTVIESSSGNMGIGLAQACVYLDLHFICVVDPKITQRNLELLKVYGARIEMVRDPDPVTGEFLTVRWARVQTLLQEHPSSFWPNQYANVENSNAHHRTMHEIVTSLDRPLDHVFCAASSFGTLRGCAEYVRMHGLSTRIWAVDAVGSTLFGNLPAKRLIPGHGSARVPELLDVSLVEGCVHVSDFESIIGCRRLLRREAILAGGSSGAVLMAVDYTSRGLPAGATCAAVFPDRGDRYIDTIFSDAWVTEHFGDVSAFC